MNKVLLIIFFACVSKSTYNVPFMGVEKNWKELINNYKNRQFCPEDKWHRIFNRILNE